MATSAVSLWLHSAVEPLAQTMSPTATIRLRHTSGTVVVVVVVGFGSVERSKTVVLVACTIWGIVVMSAIVLVVVEAVSSNAMSEVQETIKQHRAMHLATRMYGMLQDAPWNACLH